MKNMKKTTYIWAITLVIAGLVISSAASLPAPESAEAGSVSVVERTDLVANTVKMATSEDIPLNRMAMPLETNPVFAFEGDQLHPALGRATNGYHMTAYRDGDLGNIIWTFSADDGVSYDPGVYYDISGDYPSIKLWDDGTRFYGTFVTDYLDANGGPTYLFDCTDPTDTGTYQLRYWDWSAQGWHDMLDADVACDNSQNPWEWGFNTYVISTTYGNGYTDGPTVTYMDPDSDGSGWISWYYVDNCAHTDVDLDHETLDAYLVYDNDEFLTGSWKLLVRVKDFENAHQGADSLYDITGAGNLEYPAVAAQNGSIVILAETDENGNKDIICLYGNSIQSLSSSFVAMEVGDERFPDVRHVEEDTFVASFVSDGTLYKSLSEDAGATWSTPEIVDDAEEEYKTADICDAGPMAMYEKSNGADIDIWLENEFGPMPTAPIIEIASISGGIGVSAVITNTGTEAAADVDWSITVTGGILGLINKEATGTIASLDIAEEVIVQSGMIIGLGAISVTVTAGSAEETASGTQIIIFSSIS